LTVEQRKVLLLLALTETRGNPAPLWSELREFCGVRSRRDFVWLMLGLRKKGLVAFTVNEERSTRVTDKGSAAALKRAS
jgi:hypothetical protein